MYKLQVTTVQTCKKCLKPNKDVYLHLKDQNILRAHTLQYNTILEHYTHKQKSYFGLKETFLGIFLILNKNNHCHLPGHLGRMVYG